MDFEKLISDLEEEFGTREDDKLDKNDKLDEFLQFESDGTVNFYICMVLLTLDPNQEFETWRSNFKMFLLPAFQILVPFGMCWYFLVQQDLFADQGFCCNHDNYIFRFTGFVTFMYSGWQIIDGCDDATAKFFVTKAVKQWCITGRSQDLKTSVMFYMAYVSQQLCSMLLLIVTYVIYTSQCDTPLDLLMNCVAINFVLDIDTEWMNDTRQAKSQASAQWWYKQNRDAHIENGAEIKQSMKHFQSLRKAAPSIVNNISKAGDWLIVFSAYLLVFGWTFCPAKY